MDEGIFAKRWQKKGCEEEKEEDDDVDDNDIDNDFFFFAHLFLYKA